MTGLRYLPLWFVSWAVMGCGPNTRQPVPSTTAASIEFFEARLATRPNSYLTAQQLSARLVRRFVERGHWTDLDRAERTARHGLTLMETAAGHGQLAGVLLTQHRFADAERHALRAMELAPHRSFTRAGAFDALVERGARSEAIDALEGIDAGSVAFLIRHARIHGDRADFQSAQRTLRRACRAVRGASADPQALAWCAVRLGETAYALGRDEHARERWREALSLVPRHPDAMQALAWMAYRAGDLATARSWYERLHALGRDDHLDAMLALATIAARRGDPLTSARYAKAFETAALQSGREPVWGHHLAEFLATQPERAQDALAIALREVDRRPTAESYEIVGWAWFQLGRTDKALSAFASALAAGPGDGPLLYRAGIVHLAGGHDKLGRRLLEGALARRFELDPADEIDAEHRIAASHAIS